MKPPFRQDDAFLEAVAASRRRGATALWWLGQSGFWVTTPDLSVLFDPYLSDSLTRKYAATDKPHVRMTGRVVDPARLSGVDVITSSHNHTDHLDAETLHALWTANPQAKLVIPRANREFVLDRLGPVEPRLVFADAGQWVSAGLVRFLGIPAAHNAVDTDDHGRCLYLGYVARIGGLTIYHSGDTLWHAGLVPALQGLPIDVALLPINGNRPERRVAGNLDGREAARLAKEIGARLVIPCHYDLFEFNTASPDEFAAACQSLGQPFRVLQNGEGVELVEV